MEREFACSALNGLKRTLQCRSSEEVFNPRPSTPSLLCHSLIELLSIVSPAFKRNFALVQKKRMQKHPFERVATPYQVKFYTGFILQAII
jgi:protein TIF31